MNGIHNHVHVVLIYVIDQFSQGTDGTIHIQVINYSQFYVSYKN